MSQFTPQPGGTCDRAIKVLSDKGRMSVSALAWELSNGNLKPRDLHLALAGAFKAGAIIKIKGPGGVKLEVNPECVVYRPKKIANCVWQLAREGYR